MFKKCLPTNEALFTMIVESLSNDTISFNHNTTTVKRIIITLNFNKNWKSNQVTKNLHLWITILILKETVVEERSLKTIKFKKSALTIRKTIDNNMLKVGKEV
jgi:hypothetical protein